MFDYLRIEKLLQFNILSMLINTYCMKNSTYLMPYQMSNRTPKFFKAARVSYEPPFFDVMQADSVSAHSQTYVLVLFNLNLSVQFFLVKSPSISSCLDFFHLLIMLAYAPSRHLKKETDNIHLTGKLTEPDFLRIRGIL